MNRKEKLMTAAAIIAALQLGAIDANAGEAKKRHGKAREGKEKCYGVAKAGHNACHSANGSHGCATLSKVDGDPNEWLIVPKGLCEKLVGGSLTPPSKDSSGDAVSSTDKQEDKTTE